MRGEHAESAASEQRETMAPGHTGENMTSPQSCTLLSATTRRFRDLPPPLPRPSSSLSLSRAIGLFY
eukprot:5299961-Pleurochrysis_carterae.AAC.2